MLQTTQNYTPRVALSMVRHQLEKVEDLEDGMEEVLSTFEEKHTHSTLHTVAYY